ncbi:MAG: NUDIX domain-containing protein [Gemmatimonadales bacterium]
MTGIAVHFVDVYPIRFVVGGAETLVLRRSAAVRCTGAWEAVHGHIEAGETPVTAALRELLEETGLAPTAFYNLSRTEAFYLHRTDEVAMIPAFAAIVDPAADVVVSEEHDEARWLSLADARTELAWPRERRALADIEILLGNGDAGPLEDVLRVRLD